MGMRTVPYDVVKGHLHIDSADVLFVSRYLDFDRPSGDVPAGHALLVMLADLLLHMGFKLRTACDVAHAAKDDVIAYAQGDDARRLLTVQVLDGRYVALPGWAKPWDVREGRFVDALPGPPIVSLAVCVTGLLDRVLTP